MRPVEEDEKEFCQLVMTGNLVGAIEVADFERGYLIEPDDNVITIVNKRNGVIYKVTVECIGQGLPPDISH
jgi:hypothetical protein